MLNDLKENDKIIFETEINIPNNKILVIDILGWSIFYIIVYC